jgi:hypothetical protein
MGQLCSILITNDVRKVHPEPQIHPNHKSKVKKFDFVQKPANIIKIDLEIKPL